MTKENSLIRYITRILLLEAMICYIEDDGVGLKWIESFIEDLEKVRDNIE